MGPFEIVSFLLSIILLSSIQAVYHSLFSHPCNEKYLGYFQICSLITNAFVNIHVYIFLCTYFFISLGLILRSVTFGSYGRYI